MSERISNLHYIHLPPGTLPPNIKPNPCRAIVLIEQDVSQIWQDVISRWIVETGCLFMMA